MESLSKDIKCPICNRPVTLKVDSEIINCNICKRQYIYKYCLECSQIIFFNKIGTDNYNIQCPYISCKSICCTIKCENKGCNKKIFSKNKYFQGNRIECLICHYNFKKVKCPCLDCPKNLILDLNFLEGKPLECKHNNGNFIFQKVGCWFCGRHCIWNNSKGKYYIEGQLIICPYKECGRVSNKVICPKCKNSTSLTKGLLEMGKKLVCRIKGCENVYNIFFCPYCKKTNYGNGTPVAGKNLICNYCKESFSFVNCFYCKQINFWKKPNKYLPYQSVICSNESCRKKTALIPCPFCNKTNLFSRGYYILGQKYECSYKECKNEFVILYCGNCNMTHIKKTNLDPKVLYTCDNCKNLMPTIQCQKCFKFCCLGNNTKIETHSLFKCPYEKCGEICYHYICTFCNHDFNSNTYNSFNLKCPFQNCNKIFAYFKCRKCLKDNYIENSDNNRMECDELNCLYCNEINEITNLPDKNKIIYTKKAYITQGEKYDFDNPEEDPYDRLIINALIPNKIYEIPFSDSVVNYGEYAKKCVLCLTNEAKWILAPCGHKCICERCGENEEKIKEKLKGNCPICKEIIIGALDKVIDD